MRRGVELVGWRAIWPAIVQLGVAPVRGDQLVDGDKVNRVDKSTTVTDPLGDQSVVRSVAFRRPVPSKVVALAINENERKVTLPSPFLAPVSWDTRFGGGATVGRATTAL